MSDRHHDVIEEMRRNLGCVCACEECAVRYCMDAGPTIFSLDDSREQPVPVGSRQKEVPMFRCHMLVTEDLRPMGKGIRIVENWGTITLVIDDNPKDKVTGKHLFLEGDVNDFEAWLADSQAWMGIGHPMLQSFELTPFSA